MPAMSEIRLRRQMAAPNKVAINDRGHLTQGRACKPRLASTYVVSADRALRSTAALTTTAEISKVFIHPSCKARTVAGS